MTQVHEIHESKQELVQVLAKLHDNFPAFCRSILDEMFPLEFSGLHRQILDLISSTKTKKKLALAPRGLGKTTVGKAVCVDRIAFRKRKFIVYISNSLDHAMMQTENIKREFFTNQKLKKIFGNVKNYEKGVADNDVAGLEEGFSKTASVLFDHTLLLPRGCGQQIRGLNWRNCRPDLIILDDPENRSELRNENNRRENLTWFQGDVSKCVSLFDKNYEFLYLDTLKHADALPAHIMKMKDWECIRLGLCDMKYKSLCPEFVSDEEILEMVESHRASGTLDEFYREYMNIAVSPETASFKQEYFKYYEEADLDHTNLINMVILDPARSVTPQADFSAIVGVGIDVEKRARYVRDVINRRMYPDEMFAEVVLMANRLGAKVIGIEVTGLKEFIMGPFKDYLVATGNHNFEIVELNPRRQMRKEERIASLIPAYRRGLMYHNKSCCNELEAQLMSFPNSQYDDVMDALAYVEEMLELGKIYNLPTKEDSTPLQIEREYLTLDNEPGLTQEQFMVI